MAVVKRTCLPLILLTAKTMQPVFITDLDGTLLGHDDFSFTPIRDDFLNLLDRGIQIIFNSSKTATEIRALCDDLDVKLPFICENGAALFNPICWWATSRWLIQCHPAWFSARR